LAIGQPWAGVPRRRAMKVALAALTSLALPVYGLAQTHITASAPDTRGATGRTAIDQRLDVVARGLLDNRLTSPRLAVIDVAWPSTIREYESAGKYGVLLVAAASAEPQELPLRRVYLRVDAVDVPLQMVVEFPTKVSSTSPLGSAVGRFREDAFYLVPISLMKRHGLLLADFGDSRSEFRLAELPFQPPSFTDADDDPRPTEPDQVAVLALMRREFPGYDFSR
jgi:hypothetical protein